MENNYDPEIYDIMHTTSFDGDIEWYCRQAVKLGGPVLELGAGTGRTVLSIAREGIEIHALEKDRGMLHKLKEKVSNESQKTQELVTCVEGDMRWFELQDKFMIIQIPFRAFLCNKTREDQLACLKCCYSHLKNEGHLSMNIFHPSLDYMSQNRGQLEGVWRWRGDTKHPDGGVMILSEANRYDTVNQRVSSKLRYEYFNSDGNLQTTHVQMLELSYLYPGDIRELLSEAGFSRIRIDGGFDGKPLDRDGGELVIRASK